MIGESLAAERASFLSTTGWKVTLLAIPVVTLMGLLWLQRV